MTDGFSLGDLIEAGSGALLLLTGIAVFSLARDRHEVRLLGLVIATWGLSHLAHYLVGPTGHWASALVSGALLVFGFVAAWRYPTRPARGASWCLAALVALCLVRLAWSWWANLAAGRIDDLVRGVGNPPLDIALSLTALAFIPSAWAVRGLWSPSDAPRLARLTLVFGLYGAYNAGSVTTWLIGRDGQAEPVVYYMLALSLLPILIWLLAGATGGPARLARSTALAIPGVALLGAGVTAFLNWEATYEFGIPGAFRTLGWGILAMTILQHELLGRSLPRLVVSRGSLATAALAALFIVAQIAQEFFASEYGLLLGGVVAGTLLFAANPVQRAMERVTESPRPTHGRVGPDAARDDSQHLAYKRALRLALRDRRVTPDEELEMARLAEDLGIGAASALVLRRQVEAELGQGGAAA